jgi:probable F420-dependent oxidoreductase
MKFALMFANAGPLGYPDQLAHTARVAEEVGLESIWTVEHVVIPVGYQSKYPYDPSGKIPGPENVPIPDPILPLAYAAALTSKIRLGTGVVILPQRHPVYVAKEMATLDVLSRGRAILGIGSGWLSEEFETVGVPFKERGARTDESIRALRSLWADEPSPFAGKFYRWAAVESHPKPVQRPGVPIVVGGHSEAAAKRAARLGDGFFPAIPDAKRLAELFGIMRAECARIGRKAEEIELTAGGAMDVDGVRRLQDLGVARIALPPPGFDNDSIRQGLQDFAERVIARV